MKEWLLNNIELVLGTIVTLLGIIFGTSFVYKKNIQKSGKNSSNIQIGEINYERKK